MYSLIITDSILKIYTLEFISLMCFLCNIEYGHWIKILRYVIMYLNMR